MQNLRDEAKFKLTRQRKNKLINGHGGMIIQLRAAIFERIWNVQIQALRNDFICLLSLPFCAFFIFHSKDTDVTLFELT